MKKVENKPELVVLAMFLLGGTEKALDIEDIAMKCEEISPGIFAWRKYKNQINLELVGFAVRDAKKSQFGSMVTGSHAKGWRLTTEGANIGQKLSVSSEPINLKPSSHKNLDTKRLNNEIQRILHSNAYQEWVSRGKSSKEDIKNLLRINAYSSQESIELKLNRLSKVINYDSNIDDFIKYVITIKGDLL